MELKNGIETFYAKSQNDWRKWLEKHHQKKTAVWLIFYKKDSGVPSVYYPEAVDEALCFGWIDSKPNKRDEKSYYRFFSPRKPKSGWSLVNKKKVAVLIQTKRMAEAGLRAIAVAKQNGAWNALDEVEELLMPDVLRVPLHKNKKALGNWEKFPPSSKKIILSWINSAKTVETKTRRVKEAVELAAQNIRANHYRQ